MLAMSQSPLSRVSQLSFIAVGGLTLGGCYEGLDGDADVDAIGDSEDSEFEDGEPAALDDAPPSIPLPSTDTLGIEIPVDEVGCSPAFSFSCDPVYPFGPIGGGCSAFTSFSCEPVNPFSPPPELSVIDGPGCSEHFTFGCDPVDGGLFIPPAATPFDGPGCGGEFEFTCDLLSAPALVELRPSLPSPNPATYLVDGDPCPVGTRPLFQYYASGVTDHYYSTDYYGLQIPGQPHRLEGVAACVLQAPGYAQAFYGWYRADGTDHFYTRDNTVTMRTLLKEVLGYVEDGRQGFILPGSGIATTVPLYRLSYYNNGDLDHFYTISKTTRDSLRYEPGWGYDGIEGYVVPPLEAYQPRGPW